MALLPISSQYFVRIWSKDSVLNASTHQNPLLQQHIEPNIEVFERISNLSCETQIPVSSRHLFLTIQLDASRVGIFKSIATFSVTEMNRIWGLKPAIDSLLFYYNSVYNYRQAATSYLPQNQLQNAYNRFAQQQQQQSNSQMNSSQFFCPQYDSASDATLDFNLHYFNQNNNNAHLLEDNQSHIAARSRLSTHQIPFAAAARMDSHSLPVQNQQPSPVTYIAAPSATLLQQRNHFQQNQFGRAANNNLNVRHYSSADLSNLSNYTIGEESEENNNSLAGVACVSQHVGDGSSNDTKQQVAGREDRNLTSSSAEAVVIAGVPDGYYDDAEEEDDEDNINTTDVN